MKTISYYLKRFLKYVLPPYFEMFVAENRMKYRCVNMKHAVLSSSDFLKYCSKSIQKTSKSVTLNLILRKLCILKLSLSGTYIACSF